MVVTSQSRTISAGLAVGLALLLAGCETTGSGLPGFGQETVTSSQGESFVSTTSQYDTQTGQRVLTGGSFQISSGGAMPSSFAPMGTWVIQDDYARRCTVSFGLSPLSGASGARVLEQTGFCSSDFADARGWMAAGNGFALTNENGRIIGQFTADGQNSYSGTMNSVFGPRNVKLTRG